MSDFKNVRFYYCLVASFCLNYWGFNQEYLLKTHPQPSPRSINLAWFAPPAPAKPSKSIRASQHSAIKAPSSEPEAPPEVSKATSVSEAKRKHTVFPARPQAFHRIDIDWSQLEQRSITQKKLPQAQKTEQSIMQGTAQKEPIRQAPAIQEAYLNSKVPSALSAEPSSLKPNTERKTESQLLEELKQMVDSYLQNISVQNYYPRRALSRGWEGTVQLALQFEETGKLASFSISKQSDFKILDSAALKMIEQHQSLLSQYVQQSSWDASKSKRSYTLISPISFSVTE